MVPEGRTAQGSKQKRRERGAARWNRNSLRGSRLKLSLTPLAPRPNAPFPSQTRSNMVKTSPRENPSMPSPAKQSDRDIDARLVAKIAEMKHGAAAGAR